MNYSQIPTEIKFNILSQAAPQDLHNISHCSNESKQLISHIIKTKLQHHLQKSLSLSLYSANNKESTQKLFYEVDYQINPSTTFIKINKLHHIENILKPSPSSTEKSNQAASLELPTTTTENHMDLILNEDQSSTKISFNLLLDGEIINESSIRINKESPKLISEKDKITTKYSFVQGEKLSEKWGYDYDVNYEYSLNFNLFAFDNVELLKAIEKNESLIVRY